MGTVSDDIGAVVISSSPACRPAPRRSVMVASTGATYGRQLSQMCLLVTGASRSSCGGALAVHDERGEQAVEVHGGRLAVVSAERDELRKLVERLPDEQVPVALDEVRRRLADAQRKRGWLPAFFGAGRAGRIDVAERAEEMLDEGFGHSA